MPKDDDVDLRIVMPNAAQLSMRFLFALSPGVIEVNYTGVWRALRSIRNGSENFYMSALDPEQHPGLSVIVRSEKYAELQRCALARHDLAYWEKPFRVDGDWCSPSFLTDHGEVALAAGTAGYCWSLNDRRISQEATREWYKVKLRWNDAPALKLLNKLKDDWLADLRQCIDPVAKGYQFNPALEAIDIDLTIQHYMLELSDTLTKKRFETVRAMNDPRMDAVLSRMSWMIMTGDARKVMMPAGDFEEVWTAPADTSLTF